MDNKDMNNLDANQYERDILYTLLFSQGYVKLQDIADKLYVSYPTVTRFLKSVKAILRRYDLSLQIKPSHGIKAVGSEINLRKCFIYYCHKYLSDNLSDISCLLSMNSEDHYLIEYIIRKALIEDNVSVTETGIKNLVMHIMYAIYRIKNGNCIHDDQFKWDYCEDEKSTAVKIADNLSQEYNIQFNEQEVNEIYLNIIGKKGLVNDNKIFISKNVEEIIKETNLQIKENLGYNFNDDIEFYTSLAMHIEALIVRNQHNMYLPNPIIEEIKSKCMNGYECAVIFKDYVNQKHNIKIGEDELGYLAIHYNLAIERLDDMKKKTYRFLLVCGNGTGTALFLEKKIEKQFQVKRENIDVCDLLFLKNKNLSAYDYIISTVLIPFKIDKKIIYIDNIWSDEIIPTHQMNINHLIKLINRNLIFLKCEFKSKEEIIEFLCKKVLEEYPDCRDFKKSIEKREVLSSTDIGNLVAIPHPFHTVVENSFMAVCTLAKAIKWEKNKVKYVFLVAYAKKDYDKVKNINDILLDFIYDEKWLYHLGNADTITEIMDLLERGNI